MGWFTKKTPAGTPAGFAGARKSAAERGQHLLVTSEAVADFGRHSFLKSASEVDMSKYAGPMGVAYSGALDIIRPLFDALYLSEGADSARSVVAELTIHSRAGVWEAFGAWKFCDEFLDTRPELWTDLETAGVLALDQMQVSNLGFQLGMRQANAYVRVTGKQPPNDGFFGPPVFKSSYGPSLDYYVAAAEKANRARRPMRIQEAPGVQPSIPADAINGLWDFAQLVFCGPAVIGQNRDSEADILSVVVEAAYGVDHEQFARQLLEAVREKDPQGPGWFALGAARLIEDYLDPRVAGTAAHLELLRVGFTWLRAPGAWAVAATAQPVFTSIEAAHWEAAGQALEGPTPPTGA